MFFSLLLIACGPKKKIPEIVKPAWYVEAPFSRGSEMCTHTYTKTHGQPTLSIEVAFQKARQKLTPELAILLHPYAETVATHFETTQNLITLKGSDTDADTAIHIPLQFDKTKVEMDSTQGLIWLEVCTNASIYDLTSRFNTYWLAKYPTYQSIPNVDEQSDMNNEMYTQTLESIQTDYMSQITP